MHPVEALKLLREHRTDEVIIATMGAEREWLKLSQHPRDFCYVPSSICQALTLGLGSLWPGPTCESSCSMATAAC